MGLHKIGLLLCTFWILHTASFVLEWVYQYYCYPITWTGYVTSLFTHSSRTCTALRRVSWGLDEALFKNLLP